MQNPEHGTLALVSLFTRADPELYSQSSHTLLVCEYLGDDGLLVVSAKSIQSVVAMIPFVPPNFYDGERWNKESEYFFVVEKLGLGIGEIDGSEEWRNEDNEGDDDDSDSDHE